jgi:hypothetical protein
MAGTVMMVSSQLFCHTRGFSANPSRINDHTANKEMPPLRNKHSYSNETIEKELWTKQQQATQTQVKNQQVNKRLVYQGFSQRLERYFRN